MIKIHDHNPTPDELMIRVDLYKKGEKMYEGGALFAGKDSKGAEYKPKQAPKNGLYNLPRNSVYGVDVGETPAIQFPFKVELDKLFPDPSEALDPGMMEGPFDDNLLRWMKLTAFDSDRNAISLNDKIELLFKELASVTMFTGNKDQAWMEYYVKRTPEVEKFLKQYRL